MTRLYILVEGQTEERFVKDIISPHLLSRQVDTAAIIVATRRERGGRKRRGGGHWKHWLSDLRRLLSQQRSVDCAFSTLFDLYGLPDDFPNLESHRQVLDPAKRAGFIEAEIASAAGDPRLIPYVQVHEFEALVLAALGELRQLLDREEDLTGLQTLVEEIGHLPPEAVNDGQTTAPSKRLSARVPAYRKVLHGPLALEARGLDGIRGVCPRFGSWIARLEGLEPS